MAHSDQEARVTLAGVKNEPGMAGRIFTALAAANVNVDVIIQNEPVSTEHGADLSFTVARDDLAQAVEAIEATGQSSDEILTDERIGKVSIVGAGMRSHPGVAAQVFRVLGEESINIEMISTSPIKISCVISSDRVADAVRALHESFGLGAESVHEEEPTGVHHRARVGQ
ncbi:MAG: ACT domain-containing protein [Solirubrobacterales bacterium]